MPVFRDCWQSNRTAENGLLGSKGATVLAFLWRAHAQSSFRRSIVNIADAVPEDSGLDTEILDQHQVDG
jgi:hypothetical protein